MYYASSACFSLRHAATAAGVGTRRGAGTRGQQRGGQEECDVHKSAEKTTTSLTAEPFRCPRRCSMDGGSFVLPRLRVLCVQLPCVADQVRHGVLGSTVRIGAPMTPAEPPTSWRQRHVAPAGFVKLRGAPNKRRIIFVHAERPYHLTEAAIWIHRSAAMRRCTKSKATQCTTKSKASLPRKVPSATTTATYARTLALSKGTPFLSVKSSNTTPPSRSRRKVDGPWQVTAELVCHCGGPCVN